MTKIFASSYVIITFSLYMFLNLPASASMG